MTTDGNTTLEARKVAALEDIARNTERMALVMNSFQLMAECIGDGINYGLPLLAKVIVAMNPEFGKFYSQAQAIIVDAEGVATDVSG